jgi:hypothetical protein
MRDLIALILTFLVIAGVLVAWRHSVVRRRRDRHSIRFQLVNSSSDRGLR